MCGETGAGRKRDVLREGETGSQSPAQVVQQCQEEMFWALCATDVGQGRVSEIPVAGLVELCLVHFCREGVLRDCVAQHAQESYPLTLRFRNNSSIENTWICFEVLKQHVYRCELVDSMILDATWLISFEVLK